MIRIVPTFFVTLMLAAFAGSAKGLAATTNLAPDFQEVYDLLKSNLTGVSETELNCAAVEGLLTNLRGKVSLLKDENSGGSKAAGASVAKAMVLEQDVAYLRLHRIADGLAQEIESAQRQLSETNTLKGLVLDLRFADGDDFAAAAAAADLFVAKERPLMDWGAGMAKSKEKPNPIKLPVAVLVNRDTTGAAEALSAILRETGSGLILGTTTAGGAMTAREFTLSNGQQLRIASVPVKLSDGTPLSAQGVKPDIEVAVASEQERAYLEDPYATPPARSPGPGTTAGTDTGIRPVRRQRISEADLVRERREGTNFNQEDFTAIRDREPEKPLIRDPVLARAVDLLKGLALIRRVHS